MLKMKLPIRTAEEGGDETAEDELEQPDLHISSVSGRLAGSEPRQTAHPSQLDKETVFEWFGLHLDPAKRVEFMCGLLHMCQPLELRFLGSCLEDLARKDYHVLRDFENRANTPNDLGILSDVIDPVIRSKLLVCLSLLGSDSRECAGILFRILSHVDPASFYKTCGYSSVSPFGGDPQQHRPVHLSCVSDGRPEQTGPLEQLALLFTMASLHPAFPFHQRETIRLQLDKIELAMEEDRQQNQHRTTAGQLQKSQQSEYLSPGLVEGSLGGRGQGLNRHSNQTPPSRRAQREAVHIERIILKSVFRTRFDREYNFEVMWSNSSSSKVTKTHLELENFLLKLPKDQSTESFEKSILRVLNRADKHEGREVERTLREKLLSAPQVFRQTRKVCSFFRCDSSYSSSPLCSRCSHVPLGSYKEDCSEASSQEEDGESYVQGHRKKHGSRSPSLGVSSAKVSQGESWRPGHGAELNGQADWRKRNCSLKTPQEAGLLQGPEQQEEKRRSKNKPRPLGPDREKGKKTEERASYLANGSVVPPLSRGGRQPDRKDGETSSESYSSPSSPQHHRESLDSEDEKNQDTDSHSDDSSQGGSFFPQPGTSRPPLASSSTKPSTKPPGPDTGPHFPPLSFMHPYMVPNGADPSEAPMPVPPPPHASTPDAKSLAGGPVMPAGPLVPSAVPPPGEGPPGSPALQPLVQRFKTALPLLQPGSEGGAGAAPHAHQPPVGAISVIAPGQPYAYPGPDASGPGPLGPALTDPGLAKHPGLALPSGLPAPYALPHLPSIAVAPSPDQMQTVQAVVPPAVPTHTPGPAPSPSPALTHSMAQSDPASYINSTTCGVAGGNTNNPAVSQQQQAPQQQQQQQATPPQPMGCGACGCRGSCGSGGGSGSGGASAGHAPFFFPAQIAARQMFGVPPLFQLTSLCSSSYLTPPAQTNAQQLPFFPSAPAPPPYGTNATALLHTHGHAHTDHVQAAAGYSLQQMAPAFSQRFYQHVYPASTLGLVAGLGGASVSKKNGNVSCYNCGVSGHYAQDCKQPCLDSPQQGGFRLKYAASHSSELLDNAD